MLSIKAKENAQVEVIDGAFPLGQRNTIKILIEDPNIKSYIQSIGTSTCIPENNLYTYGNFDNDFDVNKLNLSLTWGSIVEVMSGYGQNYSRCLHCITDNSEGLGVCELPADKIPGLTVGEEYILSVYVLCKKGTTLYFNVNGELNPVADSDTWELKTYKFVANSDKFDLGVIMPSLGECYIDSIQLFLASEEIVDNYYDNLKFEIQIKNPIQQFCYDIDQIVTYSKPDSEDTFVVLALPPINNVDFQDNILCELQVYLLQEIRNKYLGDTEYSKEKDIIYSSDYFVLNGYVLPPEDDIYELVIDKI